MKVLATSLALVGSNALAAATAGECVGGAYAACQELIDRYGATTDKRGAVELFARACASPDLRVVCRITSTRKAETLARMLELSRPGSAQFVMNGKDLDKIYQMSQVD